MTLHEMPDLVQGSDDWLAQRRGIVTASVVGRLLTTRTLGASDYDCPECGAIANTACIGKRAPNAAIKTMHPERVAHAREVGERIIDVADNDQSRGLTLLLAAERITGWTEPTYVSDDMLRGTYDEPLAVDVYSEHFASVKTTGFMVRDDWGFPIGYSPDGLVGTDGLVEVKSRRAKAQLETVLTDAVPAENMAQLQAGLLVSGRDWIDYLSFCGGMPPYRKRVTPDPAWQEAIIAAVTAFEDTAARMTADYHAAVKGLPMTERVIEMEMTL